MRYLAFQNFENQFSALKIFVYIYFVESNRKIMKNAFFCTLKTFRSDFFIFLEKQLDKKAMVNSKIKIELISGTAV